MKPENDVDDIVLAYNLPDIRKFVVVCREGHRTVFSHDMNRPSETNTCPACQERRDEEGDLA